MSRPTISKILALALERKIVDITIKGLETIEYWEMEQALKKRYGLLNVMIVDAKTNPSELLDVLGRVAKECLKTYIKDGDVVGVSMGTTLYHTIYSETELENIPQNVLFVPLIGGMGDLRSELHSNHLAECLATQYQGKYLPLYAPARIANSSICGLLRKEPSIASVLRLYKELNVAIVGIGYPNEKSAIKATGYYRDNEIQSLIEREVAGEICMQFYDAQGDTLPYKKDNNVIGIPLNKLKS